MHTDTPVRVGRWWEWPDGTRLPVIAGGADDDTPPEGEDDDDDEKFDEARAKAKIAKANSEAAGLRKRLKEAEEKAKKLDELENASKSETERLNERVADAERKVQEAELRALRLEVAAEKGLTAKQAARLVGTTKEELEADAGELLESFKSDDDKGDDRRPASRPTTNLRGGGDPTDEPTETNPSKLAESVPRY